MLSDNHQQFRTSDCGNHQLSHDTKNSTHNAQEVTSASRQTEAPICAISRRRSFHKRAAEDSFATKSIFIFLDSAVRTGCDFVD